MLKFNKTNVSRSWEWFNEMCFGGELVKPKINLHRYLYISPDHHVLYGRNTKRRDRKLEKLLGAYHGGQNFMVLASHENESMWHETLYHEMIHQYVYQVLDQSCAMHGKIYWDAYKECIPKYKDALVPGK